MKKHFTLEQHAQTGRMLRTIKKELEQLAGDLENAYPVHSPSLVKYTLQAEQAIEKLRADLNTILFNEHSRMDFEELGSIYYGDDKEIEDEECRTTTR